MSDLFQLGTDPAWLVAILLFALDYALVARSLARRGSPVPWRARLAWIAGLVVLAAALLSRIEHLATTSMLSFHLLQNVMLADWAPPLLLLGLTAPMVAAVGARLPMHRIGRPGVALGAWLTAWYVIHLPPVYDAALHSQAALGVEHLVFLLTGLVFWWPDIVDGYLSARGRVVYLFVAMVAMMPLDIFIALYPHGLYSFYANTEKLGGISVLTDQRIAGAGALAAETLVLGTALGFAVAQLIRSERRQSANPTAVAGTPRVPPTAVSMPPQ